MLLAGVDRWTSKDVRKGRPLRTSFKDVGCSCSDCCSGCSDCWGRQNILGQDLVVCVCIVFCCMVLQRLTASGCTGTWSCQKISRNCCVLLSHDVPHEKNLNENAKRIKNEQTQNASGVLACARTRNLVIEPSKSQGNRTFQITGY